MDEIAPRESPRQHGSACKLDPSLPLKPRLEWFAQGRAAGLSRSEAYVRAGYAASSANACALDKKEHVRARINYLVGQGGPAAAPGSPGASSKTGEMLGDPVKATPELTREWVLGELYSNVRRVSEGKMTAVAANACNKVLDLIGRELGMWQTPYTPPAPPDQEDSVLSGFRLDEAFSYMAAKIGHEKVTAIMAKLAPPAAKAPAGNGQGGNGSAPPAGSGAAKPNGKTNGGGH